MLFPKRKRKKRKKPKVRGVADDYAETEEFDEEWAEEQRKEVLRQTTHWYNEAAAVDRFERQQRIQQRSWNLGGAAAAAVASIDDDSVDDAAVVSEDVTRPPPLRYPTYPPERILPQNDSLWYEFHKAGERCRWIVTAQKLRHHAKD